MAELKDNRLVKAFAALRAAGAKMLLPFITAGWPDLAATEALLGEFAARGVRVCELGIPFSDPIADGPVIQASYTEALARGVDSDKIFEMVRRFRQASRERERAGSAQRADGREESHDALAIVAMVSYSIVFRHGVEAYLLAAAEAGFDGLIVPDLPMEEADDFERLASARGLANVLLIAPTTPPDRQIEIAKHSRGFIYYISVAGITGERDRLPARTIAAVAELRTHTDTPVCVGFGISNPATVADVCRVADGAIVGSAIVHRITDAKDAPRAQLVRRVGDFVESLLSPVT